MTVFKCIVILVTLLSTVALSSYATPNEQEHEYLEVEDYLLKQLVDIQIQEKMVCMTCNASLKPSNFPAFTLPLQKQKSDTLLVESECIYCNYMARSSKESNFVSLKNKEKSVSYKFHGNCYIIFKTNIELLARAAKYKENLICRSCYEKEEAEKNTCCQCCCTILEMMFCQPLWFSMKQHDDPASLNYF